MAEPNVPDWLTKEFFQSCLQSQEEQSLNVTDLTIKPVDIAEGNNCGSQLLQVKVDYIVGDTNSTISCIIKQPLTNQEQLMGDDKYEREMKFYSEFINETYKYSRHDLVPKFYKSPNPLLEDLKTGGYVMVDRHNFLDFEHCQLVLKAKAKLHALSIAINKNNYDLIKSLVQENKKNHENNHMGKTVMDGGLRSMVAFLEDYHRNKEYLDIIKETSKNENLWKMNQKVENSTSNKPLKS